MGCCQIGNSGCRRSGWKLVVGSQMENPGRPVATKFGEEFFGASSDQHGGQVAAESPSFRQHLEAYGFRFAFLFLHEYPRLIDGHLDHLGLFEELNDM